MEANRCIYCHRELPAGASFCPYCEKAQQKPEEVRVPGRRRRLYIGLIVAAVVLAAALFALLRHHSPKQYEGGVLIQYPFEGKQVSVFLSYSTGAGMTGEPTSERSVTLPAGERAAIPSLLFVWDEGDPDTQARFMDQVASVSIRSEAEGDGTALEFFGPRPGEGPGPEYAWITDVMYAAESGTNDIIWELKMKNGDVLTLRQTLAVGVTQTLEYHYEETPLETMEDLEALLAAVEEAGDKEANVQIFLAPVTYEGELSLQNRTVSLIGCSDGENQTTIKGGISIYTRNPSLSEISHIRFLGEGGTGLALQEGVVLYDCFFEGYDTGVSAENGSWPMLEGCTFRNNKVGWSFNSSRSTSSCSEYYDLTFIENETGVQVQAIPGDLEIAFCDCTFEGNGTDIRDPQGLVIRQ